MGEDGRVDVLVCDDEAILRELLREALAAEGLSVVAAADGDEGLRLGRERRPRVMITDLGLPGLDGWELARELKGLDPALSVVVCTGWRVSVSPAELAAAGVDEVVAKPFDVAWLAARIRDRCAGASAAGGA